MDPALATLSAGIKHTLDHLKAEFSRLQTGRASATLVESVSVIAYGQSQPIKAVAGISVLDAKTIVVQPWDRGILGDIEKALQQAELGTNPVNDGVVLRITLPPMTEERRKQLVKLVQKLAEEARISVRQLRQEVHTNAKKDKTRSEDEHFRIEKQIQEMIEKANKDIEELAKKKENEIMTI
jgi:ribosome recycling factor